MDYGDDYYLIPKVLFQDDFYKDLVPLDVIVYSVLRNKQEEAIEKGWVDDEGNILGEGWNLSIIENFPAPERLWSLFYNAWNLST